MTSLQCTKRENEVLIFGLQPHKLDGLVTLLKDKTTEIPIHPHISNYEPLNYETIKIPNYETSRQRRDSEPDGDFIVRINFSAFNRNFKLSLCRNRQMFHPEAILSIIGKDKVRSKPIDHESANVFKGILQDEPKTSVVHGHIIDGVFDGVIKTREEVYHMEPVGRFLNTTVNFHSVIYKDTDIQWNNIRTKTAKNIKDKFQKKLRAIQMSTMPIDNEKEENIFHLFEQNISNLKNGEEKFDSFLDLTSEQRKKLYRHDYMGSHGNMTTHGNTTSRHTRSAMTNSEIMKTCLIYLVADHTFYQDVAGSNSAAALSEMAYIIQEADSVYRATDFNGDGKGDNIGFSIAGVTIFTHATSKYYKLSDIRMPTEDILNKFSEYNFNGYCLGILFTNRDFSGGVLGLAWIGYSTWSGPAGGICQPRVLVTSDYKRRSMNTVVVTLRNYGGRIPQRVTAVSVMHEIGHSFGAQHDPFTPECSPGGVYGNYLMYSFATEGNKPNNRVFSECSKARISPVIMVKGRRCLQVYEGPQCGNRVVEDGEECDCGTAVECFFTDSCCTPKGGQANSVECTPKAGAQCSPKQSVCCSDDCNVIPSDVNYQCKPRTECTEPSYCNGIDGSCPVESLHPNGSVCDDNYGRCFNGECTLTPCYDLGLDDCQCHYNLSIFCHLCCQVNDSCVSAESLGLVGIDGNLLKRPAGHACANFTGYCTSDGVCASVDSEGALTRLSNLFAMNSADGATEWLQNNWYYVLVGLIAVILVAFASIVTYRKGRSDRSMAYATGRMTAIVRDAETRLDDINRRIEVSHENETREEIEEAKKEFDGKVDVVTAVGRLSAFFPTASRNILMETVNVSVSEEDAVKTMIIRGYPIKRSDIKT
ncbi:disintegrin and metalloproteinase domain-containing protein 10-like [Glandiceps talaboti]